MLGEFIRGLGRYLDQSAIKREETAEEHAECVRLCKEMKKDATELLGSYTTIRANQNEQHVWREIGDTITVSGKSALVKITTTNVKLNRPQTGFLVRVTKPDDEERNLLLRGSSTEVLLKDPTQRYIVRGHVTLPEARMFSGAVSALKVKKSVT